LFFFLFFTLSFSIFYSAERMPARGWLREWLLASRFGRFLYPLGAHLLQAAFENSKFVFGLLCAAFAHLAPPRTILVLAALRGCV